MFSTVARTVPRCVSLVVRSSGVARGRAALFFPAMTMQQCRLFSTEEGASASSDTSILDTDKGFTPEGAVFSNPKIESEWIYREEKESGKKYYINKKTNDVVMNLAPNSNLASRTRRTAAGMIDFSVSVGKVSFSL